MSSLLDDQRQIYKAFGCEGPPLLPHGDDPNAVRRKPPHPMRRKRRSQCRHGANNSITSPSHDAAVSSSSFSSAMVAPALRPSLPGLVGEAKDRNNIGQSSSSYTNVTYYGSVPDDFGGSSSSSSSSTSTNKRDVLLIRAMASYATLRTLSIPLRLSPFTPTAFLRALYLPVPSRLLGDVHVHILRLLLSENLRHHYHWGGIGEGGGASSSSLCAHHGLSTSYTVKKRADGLRYPLRGSDRLELLDRYTWPLFYDDYCHLTADRLHASLNDPTNYARVVEEEEEGKRSPSSRRTVPADGKREPAVLFGAAVSPSAEDNDDVAVADEDDDEEEDEEFVNANADEHDDSDEEFVEPRSRRSKRAGAKRGKDGGGSGSSSPSSGKPRGRPRKRPRHDGGVTSLQNGVSAPTLGPVTACWNSAGPSQIAPSQSAQQLATSWTQPQAHHRPGQLAFDASTPTATAAATSTAAASAAWQFAASAAGGQDVSSAPVGRSLPQPYRPAAFLSSTTWLPFQLWPLSVPHLAHQPPWHANGNATLLATQGNPTVVAPQPHSIRSAAPPASISRPPPVLSAEELGPIASPPPLVSLQVPSTTVKGSVAFPGASEAVDRAPVTVFDAKQPTGQPSAASFALETSFLVGGPASLVASSKQAAAKPAFAAQAPTNAEVPRFASPDQGRSATAMGRSALHASSSVDSTIACDIADAIPTQCYTGIKTPPELTKPEMPSLIKSLIRGAGAPTANPGDYSRATEKKERRVVPDNDHSNLDYPFEPSHWRHFDPLKRMRLGAPYHHLSVTDKLTILEFLIDELLDVESIAEEFHKRRVALASSSLPYGRRPSDSELADLDNADECAVCLREGDLLCCDGCVFSFHRACLGMSERDPLPEGRWLCPECQIPDPATFGTLLGGRKSELEWFSVSDIVSACNGVDASEVWKNQDDAMYIVLNGYVFRRQLSVPTAGPSLSEAVLVTQLCDNELRDELSRISAFTGDPRPWPFTQIPNGEWSTKHEDMFNPCCYSSRYRLVPLLGELKKRTNESLSLGFEAHCHVAHDTSKLSNLLGRDLSADKYLAIALKTDVALFSPYGVFKAFLLYLESELSKACMLDEFWGIHRKTGELLSWRKTVSRGNSIRKVAALVLRLVDSIHPRAFLESWFKPIPTRRPGASSIHEALQANSKTFQLFDKSEKSLERESVIRHWKRSALADVPKLLARDSIQVMEVTDQLSLDQIPTQGRRKGVALKSRKKSTSHGSAHAVARDASRSEKVQDIDETVRRGSSFLISSQRTEGSESAGWEEREGVSAEFARPTNELVSVEREDEESVPRRRRRKGGSLHFDIKHLSAGREFASVLACEPLRKSINERMVAIIEELKVPPTPEIFWPIAGKKLFPASGELPRQAIKHLSRNAGTIVAPFITYSATYEVGQAALYHSWRKRVLQCESFDELSLHLRVLQSNLDIPLIRKCASIAPKLRKPNMRSLRIVRTQRDLRTGIIYYLLEEIGKSSARWESSLVVDLPALIRDLSHRRKNRLASAKAIREGRASLSGKAPEARVPLRTSPVSPSHDADSEKRRLKGIANIIFDYRRSFIKLYTDSRPHAIRESDLAALRVKGLDALETFLESKVKRTSSDLLLHLLKVEADAKAYVKITMNAAAAPSAPSQPAPLHQVLPFDTMSVIPATSIFVSTESRPQLHDTPFAGSNDRCPDSLTCPSAQFTASAESGSKEGLDSRFRTVTGEMHGQSEVSKIKITNMATHAEPLTPYGYVVSNPEFRNRYKQPPMPTSYDFTVSNIQNETHDAATPRHRSHGAVVMSSQYSTHSHSKFHQRGHDGYRPGLQSRVSPQHDYRSHESSCHFAENQYTALSLFHSEYSLSEPRHFAFPKLFSFLSQSPTNPAPIPCSSRDTPYSNLTHDYHSCTSPPYENSQQDLLSGSISREGFSTFVNHEPRVSSYMSGPFQWNTLSEPHRNLPSLSGSASDSHLHPQHQYESSPLSTALATHNLPAADFGGGSQAEPTPPELLEGLGLTDAQLQLLLQHRYSG